MSESAHERHNDDELARFADRVMSGELPPTAGPEGEDGELTGLMQTVAGLDRVFGASGPDAARARQIKANLMKEWEASGPGIAPETLWNRLLPGWSAVTRRQIAGYAVGVVALLVIAAAFFLPGGAPGAASAGGGAPVPTILIAGGLALLIGVFWWLNRPSD
jgi:hypothetical protein